MNARKAMAAAALLAAWSGAARAQEVNLARLDDEQVNRIHVRTGAEYGLVAGLGYGRAVPLLGRTALLGADLTLPWTAPDLGNWRVRAGALVPLVAGDRWKLAGSLAPTVRATINETSRMAGLGIDLGAVGGYYAPGWFVGGELGFDWEITTYIAHRDSYRQNVFAGARNGWYVYAGARDGWYAAPAGNFRLGLQAGLSFSRYDLVLRAGQLRDFKGEGPLFPVYGTLTLDTRF